MPIPNPPDYKPERRPNDMVRSPTVRTPRKLTESEKQEARALTEEIQEFLQSDLVQLARADPELALVRMVEVFVRMEQHRALFLEIPR